MVLNNQKYAKFYSQDCHFRLVFQVHMSVSLSCAGDSQGLCEAYFIQFFLKKFSAVSVTEYLFDSAATPEADICSKPFQLGSPNVCQRTTGKIMLAIRLTCSNLRTDRIDELCFKSCLPSGVLDAGCRNFPPKVECLLFEVNAQNTFQKFECRVLENVERHKWNVTEVCQETSSGR